jgi:hypothetical protein
VHELVLVVSDLYLSQEAPQRQLPEGIALPGLQYLTRFGTRSKLAGGWRAWLARRLTGTDPGAPATVAAMVPTRGAPNAPMVWMATPVHLVTGLSSLHLDRRSVLHLSADDSMTLAAEFRRVFHDSGFVLEPLDSGDFLLFGPEITVAQEFEPARWMGGSVADAHHGNASDPVVRRLGAEIEMWLHDHPVNDARSRRGEVPVTGLWLWGGGRAPAQGASSSQPVGDASADIAFGHDAYLQGLRASLGQKVFPLPQQLADVFGYSQAQRATLVIEIGSMLHTAPTWTFFDALAQIDRAFIAPAIEALSAGRFERLVLLANDHELTLRRRDRFKLWRRTPGGLSGLQ